MSGLRGRVVKLETADPGGWRAYENLPVAEWPDRALLRLLAEAEGWPPAYVPTDAELEAIIARSRRPGVTP